MILSLLFLYFPLLTPLSLRWPGADRLEPEDKLLGMFSYLMWRQDTRTIGLFSWETSYASSVWGGHWVPGQLVA